MKRRVKVSALTGGLSLVATVAFAFFAAQVIFEGEGSTKGGTPAPVVLPLRVECLAASCLVRRIR